MLLVKGFTFKLSNDNALQLTGTQTNTHRHTHVLSCVCIFITVIYLSISLFLHIEPLPISLSTVTAPVCAVSPTIWIHQSRKNSVCHTSNRAENVNLYVSCGRNWENRVFSYNQMDIQHFNLEGFSDEGFIYASILQA